MNFIHHFRNVMDRMAEDPELTGNHISLYMALFQHWNRFHFRTPLAIIRDDMMRMSKIASTATYTRCLKDLEKHGYLEYAPSLSPYRPSYVHLFNFEKGDQKGDRKGPEKGVRIAAEKVTEPKINLINLTNTINDLNGDSAQKKLLVDGDEKNTDPGRPQSLEAVQAYFIEQKSTAAAAEKFYHYYESIGWKVGGKAAMKNWKASARYWLMNTQPTPYDTTRTKPGSLHVNTIKNYGEPL